MTRKINSRKLFYLIKCKFSSSDTGLQQQIFLIDFFVTFPLAKPLILVYWQTDCLTKSLSFNSKYQEESLKDYNTSAMLPTEEWGREEVGYRDAVNV